MKKLLIIATFCVFLSCNYAYAQTVSPTPEPPKVLVSQSFVDSATKAFELVVNLRDALQKEQMANGASAVTKAALQAQIDALNGLIAIFERKDVIYASMLDLDKKAFEVYERVIAIQSQMIERQAKQLNKGKSGFDKFLSGLKQVITLVVGIAVGKKLGI